MASPAPEHVISDMCPNNRQKAPIFKAVQLHVQQEKHATVMTNQLLRMEPKYSFDDKALRSSVKEGSIVCI